jgi:hypothetical protein
MSNNVNTFASPYFDDHNELKNFHQILFKPGRAVQVRELNQLQTLLQTQVQRFGDHVFENGSMVIPGEFNFNLAYEFVTVSGVDYANIKDMLSNGEVSIVKTGTTKKAIIVQHTANTIADPVTFYLRHIDGDNASPGFVAGEAFTLFLSNGNAIAAGTIISTGKASVFDIAAGIFYINGHFIRTDKQRILLSKYSSEPSVIVGFRLSEKIVTSADDASLFDNANGSPNYNAIGADRLKKTLFLEVYDAASAFDRNNFIELAAFENGTLKRKARGPNYNVLEETLARRTYDESGDYTVKSFGLRLREHKDTGTNDGLYPAGDTTKFVVGVEPGKAYVKGFEVESSITEYLTTEKTRTTASDNNISAITPVGHFVLVEGMNKVLSFNNQDVITFHPDNPPSDGVSPLMPAIGSARVRYAEYNNASGKTALYLYDVRSSMVAAPGEPEIPVNDSRFLNIATGVYCANQAWTATCATPRGLQDAIYSGAVFRLPISNVKTISDVTFPVRRSFAGVTDSTGKLTITASNNEVFTLPLAKVFHGNVVGHPIRDVATISTLAGTPLGKSLIVDFGSPYASLPALVNAEVIKQTATRKSKTTTSVSVTKTPAQMVNRRFTLDRSDVYKIVSIKENGIDRMSSYKLVTNSNLDTYQTSYIELNPTESTPSADVIIEFKYFEHGPGDYFSVESYDVPYEEIPSIVQNNTSYSLTDYIDFRSSTSSITETPSPFGRVTVDVEYYLPRIDKVYVSSRGDFGIIKGVPSLTPNEPPTPDNAMAIYRLNIPPYVKSVKDIQSEFINNRRYTMRDIGKLEDRVSNLEYYTTLSLLESDTASLQILDAGGNNRFKNGFIVDNFVDHSVGNFTLGDYKCSIASESKTLRPEFSSEFVDFDFNNLESTGVMKTGSLITLPYVEETFIYQGQASGTMNVNPYAVYNWVGEINLTPASDTWFDTRYVAPDVTYRVFNNGNLTQQWNSWSLNWTGETSAAQSVVTTGNIVTTIRTTQTTDISVVNDREVNRNVIPYMRSRTVQFMAKGLMPRSRVYPFFDNVDVSAYCRMSEGVYGESLITNNDGEITGDFLIPNDGTVKFRTGTKQFTLIDNPANNRVQSISTADAEYTAAGTLITRSQSIVATRQITQAVDTRVVFRDPLAQSFLVDKKGGIFLTSIDLFFASKDPSVPVSIEIRNMVNGYPGQTVVPYSVVTLKPSQVNVSTNAVTATNFKFSSPVYLADGQEYCFVVLSNCNSYNAYIATMGENTVGNTSLISKQPYVGVMFKSQNSSTWSAEQLSDMKFKLNAAKFSTGVVGQAKFVSSGTEMVNLALNPITSTMGSTALQFTIPNHGLVAGSSFNVRGAVGANGITDTSLNRIHVVTAVVDLDTVTVVSTSTATSSGRFGGAVVAAAKNVQLCTIQPMAQQLLFENTTVNWNYRGITSKSLNGIETAYTPTLAFPVPINENLDLLQPLMICNSADEAGRPFVNSGVLTATMSTQSSNISPVIDVERVGLIGVSNRVNSPAVVTETIQGQGNAAARYITKTFGLATAGKFLRVYADLSLPYGSEIKLYARVGNSESEVNAGTWTDIPVISALSSTSEFVETTFEHLFTSPFSFYQFKIVMLSTSACNIPRVKRFRGIALGV